MKTREYKYIPLSDVTTIRFKPMIIWTDRTMLQYKVTQYVINRQEQIGKITNNGLLLLKPQITHNGYAKIKIYDNLATDKTIITTSVHTDLNVFTI